MSININVFAEPYFTNQIEKSAKLIKLNALNKPIIGSIAMKAMSNAIIQLLRTMTT